MKVSVEPGAWDLLFAPSSCLAVITTVDAEGRENAAAIGTCTRVCHEPVHLAFTVGSGKDTERNVRATGEFTVNLPAAEPRQLAQTLLAGDRLPPGVSELEAAGMTRLAAEAVAPPRIADFPRHLECRVEWTREWLDRVMVVGEVVAASCDAGVLHEDGRLDWERARPAHYCGSRYGDRFVAAHHVIAVERCAS
jgi:flavin reductase (DIM6/NTAB) family NADH-FMN oxidoreductase RutF